MVYVQMLVAFVGLTVGLALLRFAYRLISYDRIEYEKSRARYPSTREAIMGRARVKRRAGPDGRVRAGLVYNKRAHRLEPNGKIRSDIVDSI
jgi:hypothetical protein